MRLRKRIGAAVLAASMAFTMLPVHSQVMVKAASTELETEIADIDAKTEEGDAVGEILPETESTGLSAEEIEALSNAENARLKAEMEEMKAVESAVTDMEEQKEKTEAGIAALADTEEADIKISGMTIADTYYSVNGKFPLYVEYQTEEELIYSQRQNLKLKVTKEDGTVVVSEQESDSYRNYFSVEECSNIKGGDNVKLGFSIVEVDNAGAEERILSTETKSVQFKAQDNYASREYLPTEENYYNVNLYLTETEAMPTGSVDGIYLMDKNNQIAAGSTDHILSGAGER